MAIEKFINGKHDDCKHEGRRSTVRRLQAAMYDQEVGEQLLVSMQVYRQRSRLPEEMVDYHTNILTEWGILNKPVEMKPGIKYPLDTEGKKDIE